MTRHACNGIEIEVESHGPEGAPAFLLIRGLSTQLVHWPESFIDRLIDAGFRVVVFDNRDCGLSTKFDEAGIPEVPRILSGEIAPPYTVGDMAKDAVGVLDALGIERAHVAGISLGGMIVQRLAIDHADRFLSLTSIMSSSGAPGLPSGEPEVLARLGSRPSDPSDRECVIAHLIENQRGIASPGFPPSDEEFRRYVEVGVDRCYCPDGSARQMAAVLGDSDRADRLAEVERPFMVIHGTADPLIPLPCGEDTAKRVPGARLEVIEGMGHDVNSKNTPVLADLLIDFAKSIA